MKYTKAANPQSVHHLDNFYIVNETKMEIVESHPTMSRAEWAIDILNEHSKRNPSLTVKYKIVTKEELE